MFIVGASSSFAPAEFPVVMNSFSCAVFQSGRNRKWPPITISFILLLEFSLNCPNTWRPPQRKSQWLLSTGFISQSVLSHVGCGSVSEPSDSTEIRSLCPPAWSLQSYSPAPTALGLWMGPHTAGAGPPAPSSGQTGNNIIICVILMCNNTLGTRHCVDDVREMLILLRVTDPVRTNCFCFSSVCVFLFLLLFLL